MSDHSRVHLMSNYIIIITVWQYQIALTYLYILDTEWNDDECIDFTMMCVFIFYFFLYLCTQ